MSDEKWFEQLIARGQKQGFLTFAEINDRMPSRVVDPKQIDGFVKRLEDSGIRILENEPGGPS